MTEYKEIGQCDYKPHWVTHPFLAKEIIVPILNDEYKVIVCFGSPKKVEKILKSWGHKPEDTKSSLLGNLGVCFCSEGKNPVIALPHKPKTATEIGTLAHEAVHAIEDIFNKIGQPPSGELFAHSVGAVVRNVLK